MPESCDSPMPIVMTGVCRIKAPDSGAKKGMTVSFIIASISAGTPGIRTRWRPSKRGAQLTIMPGAVPLVLGTVIEPSITIACDLIASVTRRPRRRNISAIRLNDGSSNTRPRPNSSCTVLRVRSSLVGPKPPVISTASDSSSAEITESRIDCGSSEQVTMRLTGMPISPS